MPWGMHMRRVDRVPGHSASSAPVPVHRRGPLRFWAPALLAVLTLGAAACTGGDDAGETREDRSSDAAGPPDPLALPATPDEACTAVLESGLRIEGGTRAALRTELGEPDSVAREAVPNRHVPEATDTVVTMNWPAATAVARVSQSKELVDAIRVTDARHLRYAGVGPGTPRDSILARLGDPGRRVGGGEPVPIGRRDPETLSYWCPSEPGAESPVVFHFRDGRVAAVEWDFYVD